MSLHLDLNYRVKLVTIMRALGLDAAINEPVDVLFARLQLAAAQLTGDEPLRVRRHASFPFYGHRTMRQVMEQER